MIPLLDLVGEIETRDDLARFVAALRRDFLDRPDEWENASLESYLAALASWAEDLDGYFGNRGEPIPLTPTWRLVGELLLAAKYYE